MPTRPRLLACAAVALLFAAACRGGARPGSEGGLDPAPEEPSAAAPPSSPPPPSGTGGAVSNATSAACSIAGEPGSYADDPRFRAALGALTGASAAALDRMRAATGLAFRDGAPPRVVLAPLRDDRVPFRLEREIVDGRESVAVRVNVEPLASGAADAAATLSRALAAAALSVGSRSTPVPAWAREAAGVLAAGDVDEVVTRAAWDVAEGGGVPAVDPDDPATAVATGTAAALLLSSDSSPRDVRRWFVLVADGEDADALLGRWIHGSDGAWAGDARRTLAEAIGKVDVAGAADLARARRQVEVAGPLAAEEVLAAPLAGTDGARSDTFAARARAVLLAAAVDAAEWDRAVAVAEALASDPGALRRSKDPASLAFSLARLAARPGGDTSAAFVAYARFARDFPRDARRGEAIEAALAIADPRSPATRRLVERVAEERGVDRLDARTIRLWVAALVEEARPGAARRVLASLGTRADDPDLEPARDVVRAAEESPSDAARALVEKRVEAWRASPSSDAERDVVEGGALAADALLAALPPPADERRFAWIAVLDRAVGADDAARRLAPGWALERTAFGVDLAALASVTPWAALHRAIDAQVPPACDARRAADWDDAALGLDAAWLARHDDAVVRLHSPAYAVRREAFAEARRAPGGPTAALLARVATDASPLLRREAVHEAGVVRTIPVLRSALGDPSPLVREAACAALADARATDAAPQVAALLRAPDPDARVRTAAVRSLARLAPAERSTSALLVEIVAGEDTALGDVALDSAAALDLATLRSALLAAIASRVARDDVEPDRAALARLFTAWRHRIGGVPGYAPDAPPATVRALVARLAAEPPAGVDRGTR